MAEKKAEDKKNTGSTPANSSAGHGDALAALQGLSSQEPVDSPVELDAQADSDVAEEIPAEEAQIGSATGLAAMLVAQDSSGAVAASANNVANEPGSASMNVGSKPSQVNAPQKFEALPMAKVLGQKDELTGAVTISPPVLRRPKRRSNDSYKVLVPIMAVLGFLLLMIGMWALAAICGMSVPGVPGRHQSGYHASLLKVDFLVLALPLSLALLVMAFMMLRQIDKANAGG